MVRRWEEAEVEVVRVHSLQAVDAGSALSEGCLTPVLFISVALLQLGWVTPPKLGVWPNLTLV